MLLQHMGQFGEKWKEAFGDAITGVHSAIKQFVDWNKKASTTPEQSKKSVLKKALIKKVIK